MSKMVYSRIIPDFDHFRFLKFISVDSISGCWNWSGCIAQAGYGNFNIGGTSFLSHRLSYLIFSGDLTQGLVIDHICKNRKCVNPEHLREVTLKVNSTEGVISPPSLNALKTACNNGHPYPESKRRCPICDKLKNKKFREKNLQKCLEGSRKYYHEVTKKKKAVVSG